MEYDLSLFKEIFNKAFDQKASRPFKMYTGVGGMDMFEEAVEGQGGMKRVYIGRKVPRWLRAGVKNIKLSRRNRYYKLVKNV